MARPAGCFTLVSNDRNYSGRPAGRLAGRPCPMSGSSGCWSCGPTSPSRRPAPSRRWPHARRRASRSRPPPTSWTSCALAVLDALLVLHADTAPCPLTKLLELIGERAAENAVSAAIDDLRERALVWGDPAVRVAAEAAAGLPWYPGQAAVEVTDETAEEIADSARRARRGTARPVAEAARRIADGPHPRRRAGHAAGPPGAATAGRGLAPSGRRRHRDPAPAGRSGDARRGAGTGVPGRTGRGRVHHHRRRRQRGGRRCRDRPAARSRVGARNPRRHTDSRAAQRRAGRS